MRNNRDLDIGHCRYTKLKHELTLDYAWFCDMHDRESRHYISDSSSTRPCLAVDPAPRIEVSQSLWVYLLLYFLSVFILVTAIWIVGRC